MKATLAPADLWGLFYFTFGKIFPMELTQAIELTQKLIDTEEVHQDYERVTDLAAKYKAMITGCGLKDQLRQFIKREDDEAFQQRINITKTITPAVAYSVRRPFNKVVRNDRIKKKIKLQTESRLKTIEAMMLRFYGSKNKKSRGLDYWLKTRFLDLQFSDPNAWVVLEWAAPETQGAAVYPRPFEVSSEQARNFLIINDEVKWLFVREAIEYFEGTLAENTKRDGWRYTLYDEDQTVVYEQCDPKFLAASNPDAKAEDIIQIGEAYYWRQVFLPNLGFPPVLRIGYNTDEETKARTFVNPWHPALCFFDKMLGTVSELDLTMALHVYPQKLQYVQKCPGIEKKKCDNGYFKDGTQCTNCGGKGVLVHSTAQEVIYLPMPETAADMLNLDQLLVYKSPPIDLIKWQNDYTLQLERQVHQAVFNSQVFIKNHYSSEQTAPDPEKTATEVDANMESVYDTLEPFTEKVSEVWKDVVTMLAAIAGESNTDKIDLVHVFPADPKLKNSGLLMAERKVAKDSGAPPFVLETIDDDLAGVIYNGDELGMNEYKVKRIYFPFTGKTEEEIAQLMESPLVRKREKVLFANFETIFKELKAENVGFFLMKNPKKQAELVEAKIQEFITALDAEQPKMDLGNFKPEGGGTDPEDDDEEGDTNPDESNPGADPQE